MFFVTLWHYEVCDNGNATKQCNFQNNYGTVAQRKVSSCAPTFKFFYGPLDFFLEANLPKIAIFGDFGGHKATRETLQRPATSTLELCATCAVY